MNKLKLQKRMSFGAKNWRALPMRSRHMAQCPLAILCQVVFEETV